MQCRVCNSKCLDLAIDLGMQPWGNHFLKAEERGKEPFYPLRVVYCRDCQTAQLDYTVKKEVMFSNHTYLSGITRSLKAHFQQVAEAVCQHLSPSEKRAALDIGSNDGTQLACFQALGFDVLGVESSEGIADIANQKGIPTVHAFFNHSLAEQLHRQFDVINASGVFFHLEELHSVTEGTKCALKEEGIFVVQFLYMKSIMEKGAFDQIYHEHLLFYTLKTLQTLLERHGLELFDAYFSPIHGGSMIGYVTHRGKRKRTKRLEELQAEEEASLCNTFDAYLQFAKKIETVKEANLHFIHACKKRGKQIFGMGAPVKGNTLLNYFGLGTESITCLVEKNPLRNGLYSPGKHIPIVMEETTSPPDVYYVLAWNFKDEILKNNQHLLQNGVQFYFPIG